MGKEIIRPIKGIDVDSSYNRRDDNAIYMAKNMRLNPIEDTNLGEYTNIPGNRLAVLVDSSLVVIKIVKVSDNIVLFIRDTNTNTDVLSLVKESDIPSDDSTYLEIYNDYYYWDIINTGYNKIISGDFGFWDTINDVAMEISVKTYYESDDVQKIYWSISGQPMRILNIIYSSKNDPSAYSETDLEFTPKSSLSRPIISKTISGNLKTGKIYYAYKLVNSIGLETQLSELSNPYHLTKSNDTGANDFGYKGFGIDVESNKGINLTISNIDASFNRLKLYSIHYIDDVSLPVVRLIYDNFVSSSLNYNDTGSSILEIAPEEFIKNQLDFNGGISEIKNNRLFISNYSEEYFDVDTDSVGGYWDSRAYRFNSAGSCPLYTVANAVTGPAEYTLSGASPAYSSIAVDADCVSRTNIRDYSMIYHKYQSNGSTIGAEGLNIKISQSYNKFIYPDNSDTLKTAYSTKVSTANSPVAGYSSYANPGNYSGYKSFKPEEIYRIAIQFRNSKGKLSYPKWICDYRYEYSENNIMAMESTISFKLKMFIQSLNVEIKTSLPVDPATGTAYPYRIMYVPITDQDEGVHYGMFTELFKVTNVGWTSYNKFSIEYLRNEDYISEGYPTVTKSNIGKYLEFVSPDYCFGNKRSYSYSRLLKSCNPADILTTKPAYGGNFSYIRTKEIILNKLYNLSTIAFSSKFNSILSQYDIEYNSDIEEIINLAGSDSFIRIGVGRRYSPVDSTAIRGGANKGRCQIIQPDIAINNSSMPAYWGCVYVDDYSSKYGGISYLARQNNGYVALSEFTTSASIVLYGDCYLGVFEYLRQICENNGSWVNDAYWIGKASLPDVVYFPVITRINTNLRSDTTYSDIYKTDGSYLIKEYAGVQEDNSPANTEDWFLTQETDLYLYNHTYSREQDLFMYYPKQTLSSNQQSFKLRINASDKKIVGELTDSFTKISPNNYIDVDGQYGEIIELKVFNDKLFFFQRNAIGIASTNERALTSIQDGSQLSMGIVNLLERYDYLTLKNGISNKNHVNVSNSSIYVIDDVRKQLLKIDNGIEKISTTKNVDSYVRFKDWSDGFIIYNRKYNEVLFFHEDPIVSTNSTALVYNEVLQQFTGIYTYYKKVTDSVEINRADLYDELTITGNNLCVLNDGDFNWFSGEYYPSEITFLFSSQDESQVLYNVIEFIAYQQDVNGTSVDFIDTIEIYTKTQSTGELPFATDVAFKFNKYRTNKLRNLSDRKRMLSDHLYVTIKTKDNDNTNYRLFIRDMIATFSEYDYYTFKA